MQIAYAFLPAAMIALMGLYGGSPPAADSSLPANMAFTVSVGDPIAPPTGADLLVDRPERAPQRVLHNATGDRLFYVTAQVNGNPVRFLVDTGSSVVILTETDARHAGVRDLGSPPMRVETASGASAMRAVNLERVDLAGQSIHNVDGAIVDANLKVSLLGQSVLSRLRSVRFAGDKLELN
jgi:aspartyl protease family protein